jgi:hypothetical protein
MVYQSVRKYIVIRCQLGKCEPLLLRRRWVRRHFETTMSKKSSGIVSVGVVAVCRLEPGLGLSSPQGKCKAAPDVRTPNNNYSHEGLQIESPSKCWSAFVLWWVSRHVVAEHWAILSAAKGYSAVPISLSPLFNFNYSLLANLRNPGPNPQ